MALFKRERKRMAEENPAEIPMTPMIDVVFQMLVYFIFTLKPEDVMANLDVLRPRPDEQREVAEVPPGLINIGIYRDGYTLNDRRVDLEIMGERLQRWASADPDSTVLINVSSASIHEMLIAVLDQCQRVGLTSISVISGN